MSSCHELISPQSVSHLMPDNILPQHHDLKIIVTSDKCISSCHELIRPQSVDKSIMHYYLQQVHNS